MIEEKEEERTTNLIEKDTLNSYDKAYIEKKNVFKDILVK